MTAYCVCLCVLRPTQHKKDRECNKQHVASTMMDMTTH